jgi:hypothetical protein
MKAIIVHTFEYPLIAYVIVIVPWPEVLTLNCHAHCRGHVVEPRISFITPGIGNTIGAVSLLYE